MKKIIFTLFLAIMATTGLYAQQISVVSSGGATKLYNTLKEAIEGASDGSVIYLPGGSFPISKDVRITKKLTIIGIGHNAISEENVDGRTLIEGSLYFGEGSSGSSVMGCYITVNVEIGVDNSQVNDFLLRYCNVWDINIYNSSLGTIINQNYIRSAIYFHGCSGIVSNNIMGFIYEMNGGTVCNNVFPRRYNYSLTLENVYNTTIKDNVFVYWRGHSGNECSAFHNMFIGVDWGDDCLNLTGVNWSDIFEKDDGVVSTSNYHFKEAYKQYEGQYGIYSGTGFNDNQMAPVPYIVAKQIPEQTDAQGKLNIKIRVKAGQ